MKKLWYFLVDNPYILMMAGMALLVSGLFMMIQSRDNSGTKGIAIGLGAVGVILYAGGRILIGSRQKFKRKKAEPQDSEDNDDSETPS